jgi:2-amino-4-hydroxy-6-hydroxymethyldihydropteridine diphosphokinase
MILIGLGANLDSAAGPPRATLASALGAMAARRIRVLKVSRFYESPAWPNPTDPAFTNAVARVQTPLGPAGLLEALHAIEEEFGRIREVRNAPRTLDLDLLDYDGRIEHGALELPHPRIAERAFVLKPLNDVAPEWRHPVSLRRASELLEAIPPAERDAVRVSET